MGACTFTRDNDANSPLDGNAGWEVRGTLFLSSSYATGGDTVTPGIFSLGELHKLILDAGAGYVFSPVVSAAGLVTGVQAWATGASSGAILAEVASATDLHLIGVSCIARGF